MLLTGRLLAGRYRLGAVLGEGGMSIVYEARDEHLRRTVALKILRPHYTADPDFLARFDREARAAASLSHPNIVAIHDSGADGDLHFIVMELVDGPSLADVLLERRSVAADRAVAIAAQVAEGLAAAHRRGLVHRDVKPGNILLDRRGRALIGDFGIAQAFGSTSLTTTGTILGSLPYLSPEQAAGEEATPLSDIYSLGIVLFEMLTGRRPFEGSSPAAVAVRRLHEDPPEPSMLEPGLPPGIDPIVLRALARAPSDRYPSARNFAQSLDAWRRRWIHVRDVVAAPVVGISGNGRHVATEALDARATLGLAAPGSELAGPATNGDGSGPRDDDRMLDDFGAQHDGGHREDAPLPLDAPPREAGVELSNGHAGAAGVLGAAPIGGGGGAARRPPPTGGGGPR